MSEEEKIESILTEAGSVGLRSRTIESAYNILNRNPNIDRAGAYGMAFNQLLSTTDEPDLRDIGEVIEEEEVDDSELVTKVNDILSEHFGEDAFDEDGEYIEDTKN